MFTGADRIAANGDTANKIGTYGLAVQARHHGVPFYVVAPSSTVDLATPSGDEIPIEERDPAEVTARFAARNPAFDVTPAELIDAIVTEHGVHTAPVSRVARRRRRRGVKALRARARSRPPATRCAARHRGPSCGRDVTQLAQSCDRHVTGLALPWMAWLVDLLFPPRCAACGHPSVWTGFGLPWPGCGTVRGLPLPDRAAPACGRS